MASSSATFILFFLAFCVTSFRGHKYNENGERATIGRRSKRADNLVNQNLFDLEYTIRKKLKDKYKNDGKELEWVSLNGSQPEIPKDIKTSGLKVEVQNIKQGEKTSPSQKISGLFSNLYCNMQTMPLKSSIDQLVKRNASFVYRPNRGLKRFSEQNAVITLRLPESLQVQNKPVGDLKVNLLGKKSDAQSVTDEVKLSYLVEVKPGTAKVVNITVVNKVIEVQYSADLVISGSVVAKYKDKAGKGGFDTFQITDFADLNYEADGDNLVFKTNGRFKGSRATNTSVQENELSADLPQCKHEELQSEGPLKIIHMKPEAKKEEDLTE